MVQQGLSSAAHPAYMYHLLTRTRLSMLDQERLAHMYICTEISRIAKVFYQPHPAEDLGDLRVGKKTECGKLTQRPVHHVIYCQITTLDNILKLLDKSIESHAAGHKTSLSDQRFAYQKTLREVLTTAVTRAGAKEMLAGGSISAILNAPAGQYLVASMQRPWAVDLFHEIGQAVAQPPLWGKGLSGRRKEAISSFGS